MRRPYLLLASLIVGSAMLSGAFAWATPVMEMRAEDLVPMAIQFREELKLTPNQHTLWLQVEARSKTILRERQGRREKLQTSLVSSAAQPKAELRDLNAAIQAEQAITAREDQQLRDMWLEVNDALDDGQRQQVTAMLGAQLMRVAGAENHTAPKGEERSQRRGSGSGGGRRGGMGAGGPGG